ncbi:MAG: DUF3427 domain-containing protein, partial [Solirubrobacteraceae bacterium]
MLDNLKAAVRRSRWTTLVEDLRSAKDDLGLAEYLGAFDHRLEDVYRGGHSWTELRRAARVATAPAVDDELEQRLLRAISRLTHIDDPERGATYRSMLSAPRPPRVADLTARELRLMTMLAWGMQSDRSGHCDLE